MVNPARNIRIGIDVGGTFTHAVAVDARSVRVLGKCKVHTTHAAAEGVACGVAESLLLLLERTRIAPGDIAMIAHSTTQATNALLEGDVAAVGIVGLGHGVGAALARWQTRIRPIPLTPTRRLMTFHRFIAAERVAEGAAMQAVRELINDGAEVIVAAGAFSVDDPAGELCVCRAAAQLGMPSTATHQISQLHGLGLRTRTAVINASMLPKMLATADLTEAAVRRAGITAPVMIMRSDGGIMTIDEMRRRPILTMLSGPAAGVAAALLYARVSDGVFLEVGGTSTDISVIKNGRTQIRNATVGGNRLHVSTLDVRTIGVAGGSLVRLGEGSGVTAIGPRSAHIAGLPYLSFADVSANTLTGDRLDCDGDAYLAARCGETQLAITPTCASNLLGLVPEGDPARGIDPTIKAGLSVAAPLAGCSNAEELARAILESAACAAAKVVEGLIADYGLDRGVLRLVAGGGGGSAIVPYLAQRMGLACEHVENADVISAIGVALALVRDMVERTVVEPTPDDIRRIREDAAHRVLRMGAAPETVQVFVEVDAKRNHLRATAEGALELREQSLAAQALDDAGRRRLVAASVGEEAALVQRVAGTRGYDVWTAPRCTRRWWGLVTSERLAVRVLDAGGTIRWASNHSAVQASRVSRARQDLPEFAELFTRYSDAGTIIPQCFVVLSDRIVDLSGLADMAQVVNVLQMETVQHAPGDDCVLLLQLAASLAHSAER